MASHPGGVEVFFSGGAEFADGQLNIVAVVGCGKIAQLKYLPALSAAGIETILLTDHSPSLAAAAASALGPSAHVVSDLSQLIERQPQLVFVLNHDHFETARRLLDSQCAVICEKPLCWRAREAEELVSIARRREAPLRAAYFRRYDPLVQTALDAVDSRGPPQTIVIRQHAGLAAKAIAFADLKPPAEDRQGIKAALESAWERRLSALPPKPARQAVRLLLELLIHDLDLLGWIARRAFRVRDAWIEHDASTMSVRVELESDEGWRCSVTCAPQFSGPHAWRHEWDLGWDEEKLSIQFGNPFAFTNEGTVEWRRADESVERLHAPLADPFALMISDALSHTIGERRPHQSALDAVQTLSLIEAIEAKLKTGVAA
ncbi:MAG: Gfo/Idh/MocA family oxidoreductase [Phycisphaerales bacterium]|nr:Gfo/Idh/MocA family oxidoreductase [Hyphomonadaceae bacterium]